MLLSTIFTVDDIRKRLSDRAGRAEALAWAQERRIDRVYFPVRYYTRGEEPFTVPESIHRECLEMFADAGIEVQGLIRPFNLGERRSTGWPETPCPCDPEAIGHIGEFFAFAATRFDKILIDNRLFFDCTCEECDAARGDLSWMEFHQKRLSEVMSEHALGAAKRANPNAHLIFKYPSWHEMIATRGFDIVGNTALYPQTCAGGETRDPDAYEKWGGRQPYGAFFTVSYLRAPDPQKCPGAWIDYLACDEVVFSAQAWGGILAGAEEIILFAYGGLAGDRDIRQDEYPAPASVLDTLIESRLRMDDLAEIVRDSPPRAVAAYRPPNGDPRGEPYLFDYLGMLGIPIAPAIEFPTLAPAAAFAQCSAYGDDFEEKLADYIDSGRPTLVTSRLAADLGCDFADSPNVVVWKTSNARFTDRLKRMPGEDVFDDPSLRRADSWFKLPSADLARLRRPFYKALNLDLDLHLPARIGVFALGEELLVLHNYSRREAALDAVPGSLVWSQPEIYREGKLPPGSISVWRIR